MGIKLNFTNIKETTSTLERNPSDGYKSEKEYPQVVGNNRPASSWGNPADIKVPLVLERDSLEGFQKEWEDWSDLSAEQKAASDRISIQLRNMTNREFFEHMLPILQKQSTAPVESLSESMSFENMKSETELKHYVMSIVEDPVKKKKIKDLFDDFQNSAILSKNNLNFDKYAHMNRNDENNIVSSICMDVMTVTSVALRTAIALVIQLGVSVIVISTVVVICLSILAGLVYGVIAAVFGIASIKSKMKWLADKFLFTTALANLKDVESEVDDKKLFSSIKDSVVEYLGITKAEASKYESGKIVESLLIGINISEEVDTLLESNTDEESEEVKSSLKKFIGYVKSHPSDTVEGIKANFKMMKGKEEDREEWEKSIAKLTKKKMLIINKMIKTNLSLLSKSVFSVNTKANIIVYVMTMLTRHYTAGIFKTVAKLYTVVKTGIITQSTFSDNVNNVITLEYISILEDIGDKELLDSVLEKYSKKKNIPELKEKYKYLDNVSVDRTIKEDYNWDEMEFGLDAMNLDYDDDTLDTVEDYDDEFKDEESEFYNYAVEKSEYNDEEVDELIRRYLRIKDSNTLGKVRNLFTDFRSAVRESAKKHGNFFIDTDEKDDEKDDRRMMTKAEAIAVVDATLASKYRMYLLAIEHFRRDSAKTLTFSLFTVILFTCIAISGLVVLLPITAVIGGTAAIGNWYAFFRDLKRTRLVIIKEIERIDNTVSRMSQEENPDKEKMKQLLEIKKALIIQAGYDEKSPKWQKLKDPNVVKKLTEMIDYFGDTMSIDDIRVNILEADAEDEAEGYSDDPPEVDEEDNKDPNAEDNEDSDETKSDTGDENFDKAQDAYLDSDPADEAMKSSGSEFKEGGSEAEEKYKMNMCISNLSTLYDKYNELKRDLISSDTYKIVNENDKNKLKPILSELVNELGLALDNLKVYIEVGDKSTYPIVAVKLSVHQNVLRVIDDAIAELVEKANKDIVEDM